MRLTDLGWDPGFARDFEEYSSRGLIPARVFRAEKGLYLVFTEEEELAAQVTGRMRHQAAGRGDLPVVGDWLAVEPLTQENKAAVHAVLPRRSKFSRKVKGSNTEEHVIVANVDLIFLVNGLDADYSPRRIERYLTLVWDSGARPVVVLNKADLCDDLDERLAKVAGVAPGAPVHAVCALEEESVDTLRQYVEPGCTIAMLGSSGVGKSTLINSLLGDERQEVRETRARDGKGRHTTTSRELIRLPGGGMIIDNPGMREVQLWAEPADLGESFADVEELAENCRFRGCLHQSEPDCAVREALEEGTLDEGRYRSYLRLRRELAYLERRQDESARRREMQKWKKIAVGWKQRRKLEPGKWD